MTRTGKEKDHRRRRPSGQQWTCTVASTGLLEHYVRPTARGAAVSNVLYSYGWWRRISVPKCAVPMPASHSRFLVCAHPIAHTSPFSSFRSSLCAPTIAPSDSTIDARPEEKKRGGLLSCLSAHDSQDAISRARTRERNRLVGRAAGRRAGTLLAAACRATTYIHT